MYKSIHAQVVGKNKFLMHLFDDKEGYQKIEWQNEVYIECSKKEAQLRGLKGEYLKKITEWDKTNPLLHFHDMTPYQKFIIEHYGNDDNPSINHSEVTLDIEIEMGGALTEEYISNAPMPVTSIAFYHRNTDKFVCLIVDEQKRIKKRSDNNKQIIPCRTEKEVLARFIEMFREMDPDIIIGYNSDFFDIPYLYYRIRMVLGLEWTNHLSPIGKVTCKKGNDYWYSTDTYVDIAGVESLDYMRLHKKYSWKEEPSYKLDFIAEKYLKRGKIKFEGNLNDLFDKDPEKYIEYNFEDVNILLDLDSKFQYIDLTKNLSHKGKHRYQEVYSSSKTHDGAISSYLLSQGIVPPPKDKDPIIKKNYAGGYLFCPRAGVFYYVFDEDLTSLYPSIIMSINIGRETYMGRIVDANDRNNRLGLNDLKDMDPDKEIIIENDKRSRTKIRVGDLVDLIQERNWSISANGVFFRTDIKSALSIVLDKWFNERVEYNQLKKKYEKEGNKELKGLYHLKQYTQKILLNSLYGCLALPSFRYGSIILSEAVTLSGQRIVQESAYFINVHYNKLKIDPKLKQAFKDSL